MADAEADKDTIIKRLQRRLKEAEDNMKLSAGLGNGLLQQNNELEAKMEELAAETSQKIEALEQEKYSLQMRLSTKENMEKNQANELETQREQLLLEAAQAKEAEQMKHSRIVQQLQTKLGALQADLEMAAITEEQLKETVAKQEEMLKCAHDKLKTLEGIMPTDDNEELMTLRQTNNTLKSEKDFLEIELKKCQDQLQQVKFLVESKEQRVEALTLEVDEERRQAISNFNALEKCRENITDLQVQLDVERMESMGHEKKGNSLFAEVEDRRKEIEQKMISLKTKWDSCKQQLALKKQQLSKLKYQIAGLLEMGGGKADAAQLERLEEALSQRNGEIELLNQKIAQLQQKQSSSADLNVDEFFKKFTATEGAAGGSHEVDRHLIDWVQKKLKDANEKTEKLASELKTERLQGMVGKDSLLRVERRLHQAESETDRLRAANIKLTIKIEDMRTKYNIPDPNAVRQEKPRTWIEKIPLPTDKPKEEETPSETPATEESSSSTAGTTSSATAMTSTAAATIPSAAASQDSTSSPEVFVSETSTEGATSSESGISSEPSTDLPSTSGKPTELVIPKLKRTSKKSLTMNETVSTVDSQGEVLEMAILKTGDERSSVCKRKTEEDCEENAVPEQGQGGGKRKPKGRKCHNVIYMGSQPKNECQQQ